MDIKESKANADATEDGNIYESAAAKGSRS